MAAHPGAVPALPDDVKKNLKSKVLELRHLFEADLGLGLKRLGIDNETGKVTPADDPALSYLTAQEREARSSLDAVLAKEAAMTKDVPEAVRALLREAAYTHLNRLIGLKCLELRGHLRIDGEPTEVVTQRKDYGDLSKYLWTLRSRDARLLGDPETLWREGLLRACTAASAELGVLFDPADPYAQVWPSHKALVQAVRTLDELPESAFRADELLGWVYQYFQSEEKDRVFAEARTKKKKIAWADIVPVTQLYTERYMVDFLLQNSIGARWMEMYPDSRAKEAWLYYVEPATPHARDPQAVKEWTLLDPCCGSGHFLVVAFDLLVHLYAEERALAEQGLVPAEWAVPEAEVARTILERNLHGIDIDPRAVQLSALALYLKAKELGLEGTPQMHLVIADCVLQRGEHYQTLLDSYRDDPTATEAIETIWSTLEHVRDLGSLVLVEEEVEAAVGKARKRSAGSFDDLATDWDIYKVELIARLKTAFAAEASGRDERQRVFGAEAEKGLGLFELLSARYDVVCTNPPYMVSGNMQSLLRQFLLAKYPEGKTDLYAAFILRCLGLCNHGGTSAMVTQRSFLNNAYFTGLRERLLATATLGVLADLGTQAFEGISGEKVSTAMHVLRRDAKASQPARFLDVRRAPGASAKRLMLSRGGWTEWQHDWNAFNRLPASRIMYYCSDVVMGLFSSREQWDAGDATSAFAYARRGVDTCEVGRWSRYWWEVMDARWVPYIRGPHGHRWDGGFLEVVNWGLSGDNLKRFGAIVPSEELYFRPCATFSRIGSSGLLARRNRSALISDSGSGVFSSQLGPEALCALLNSPPVGLLLSLVNPAYTYQTGDINALPRPNLGSEQRDELDSLSVVLCDSAEAAAAFEPTERSFRGDGLVETSALLGGPESVLQSLDALAALCESRCDELAMAAFGLTDDDLAESGWPRRWRSSRAVLLASYDTVPELPSGLPRPPQSLLVHLASLNRVEPLPCDLAALKARLRGLYIAGPSARVEIDEDHLGGDDAGEGAPGAQMPIPPETFLEELSEKLGIHPVSTYWLLEELREKEGLVCPPEAKRRTEDWLSVKALRMLGHRWPMADQNEEEECTPFLDLVWVDSDGVIALIPHMGEETLAERFRRFLDAEFGPDEGHEVERELTQALGWKPGVEWGTQKPLSLERWFQRDLFKRHVSQFKKRPIVWHLKSPKGKVQVVVYYHEFNRDRLALLRAKYLGNLRQELSGKLAAAVAGGYEDRANVNHVDQLEEQLADLNAFDDKLAQLQEGREGDARIWCPWKSPEEQPQGWDPDINDGVRINIAPLQRLGLLASEVLSKKDLSSLLAPEGRE